MRIFNGKNSTLDLPLVGGTKLPAIAPHSVSINFMPNEAFLNLIATAYDDHEIALILSGPFEMTMCSGVPATLPLVVESIEEALERFTPKKGEEPEPNPENNNEDEQEEQPEPKENKKPAKNNVGAKKAKRVEK